MASDVYLVLLEYGRQDEQAALDLLLPTLRRTMPDASIRTVIVDNATPASPPPSSPMPGVSGFSRTKKSVVSGFSRTKKSVVSGFSRTNIAADPPITRLAGDNTLREFSGWDLALAWIDEHDAPDAHTLIVLANDTVVRTEKHDRIRELPADRIAAASRGALVGYVEAYPRPVTLFGLTMRQFVDTSLVAASRQTLDALRPLARPIADEELFDDDWRRVFLESAPLSENYRAYLRTWLFGESIDDEFTHVWHGRDTLTASNYEAFKVKLRCLFCEHLLSARARAGGIPLVDIRPRALAIDPF